MQLCNIIKFIHFIKCNVLNLHKGKYNKIGITYNSYGETEHQRICDRCGKHQIIIK